MSYLVRPFQPWLTACSHYMNWLVAGLLLLVSCILTPVAIAAPASNLLDQPVTMVNINLGNDANELKFVPTQLEFVSGKRYKLVLTNPSQDKHYFTAKDFADNIWSQKVEAGKVEVKGAIHELELKPGASAEWLFVPIKPGTYQLRCTRPGHTEAGMIGTIVVRGGK